jgi:hypothetical protein
MIAFTYQTVSIQGNNKINDCFKANDKLSLFKNVNIISLFNNR